MDEPQTYKDLLDRAERAWRDPATHANTIGTTNWTTQPMPDEFVTAFSTNERFNAMAERITKLEERIAKLETDLQP